MFFSNPFYSETSEDTGFSLGINDALRYQWKFMFSAKESAVACDAIFIQFKLLFLWYRLSQVVRICLTPFQSLVMNYFYIQKELRGSAVCSWVYGTLKRSYLLRWTSRVCALTIVVQKVMYYSVLQKVASAPQAKNVRIGVILLNSTFLLSLNRRLL